jgi:hypothetical protein
MNEYWYLVQQLFILVYTFFRWNFEHACDGVDN